MRKSKGKSEVKLNDHGEKPPGSIEVVEVHFDIDKPQTEETEHDAAIHLFPTRDER